jgi:hypothetical protein
MITQRRRAMPEAGLAAEVTGMCDELGLSWYSWPEARRTRPGWVDLVVLGLGGVLFVELKSRGGRRRPAQTQVAYLLIAAGLSYRLWTPAELEAGTIGAELQALR